MKYILGFICFLVVVLIIVVSVSVGGDGESGALGLVEECGRKCLQKKGKTALNGGGSGGVDGKASGGASGGGSTTGVVGFGGQSTSTGKSKEVAKVKTEKEIALDL